MGGKSPASLRTTSSPPENGHAQDAARTADAHAGSEKDNRGSCEKGMVRRILHRDRTSRWPPATEAATLDPKDVPSPLPDKLSPFPGSNPRGALPPRRLKSPPPPGDIVRPAAQTDN